MDLLLISRCPPFPLHQGDRLIPYHLAHELSGRRHHIDLLAFYQEPEDMAEVPRYEHFFGNVTLIREPKRPLMSYRRRSRQPNTRFPRSADACWSPEMWNTIKRALQSRPYDLVHLFGGVQVYEYLNLLRQIPTVIVPYESYSLWLDRAIEAEHSRIGRWVKKMQYRMAASYESWMFDQFDRTVVLTQQDANALKALNPHTPTVVIPNGVDIEHFTPTGYEPDEPVFLFIGNYDYAPNLDAALRLVRDIFPRLKEVVPQARLYLVGGNPPPELLAYASESVELPGRVPDVRSYFEFSMIFISPLRMGAGIKNKILEAMAMQKPIVATPLSCDGIPAVNGQHVLMGLTDDDLIRHVIQLLKSPKQRQQLAQNGRQLVEQRFTWRRVADMYEDLYRQVIREHDERVQAGIKTEGLLTTR